MRTKKGKKSIENGKRIYSPLTIEIAGLDANAYIVPNGYVYTCCSYVLNQIVAGCKCTIINYQ